MSCWEPENERICWGCRYVSNQSLGFFSSTVDDVMVLYQLRMQPFRAAVVPMFTEQHETRNSAAYGTRLHNEDICWQ